MKYTGNTTAGKKRRRIGSSRLGRFVKRAILVLFFFFLGSAAGLGVVFYYFSLDLPSIGPLLEGYDPPQTTRFVASDGTVIGELFVERRTVVPIDHIPDVMVNAVIAAEDADFRAHEGLDYPGMIRAMLTNVSSGRLAQGASTITQQVARTFFLTREKTFSRKIKEILLTKRIEERLTKDEILYLYLNQINFGRARYGVGEAARFYFDKDIREITVAEAALLAGIPKGPSIYEPIGHGEQARDRRSYVLGEMAKHGFISESEAELARSAPLGLSPSARRDTGLAPEVVSKAIAELEGVVDLETLKHGGYLVETGVDPKFQRAAREAVRNGLHEIDKRHRRIAPFKKRKRWPTGERGPVEKLLYQKLYVGKVVGHDASKGRMLLDVGGHSAYLDMKDVARYNPGGLKAAGFAAKGAKLQVALIHKPKQGPARVEMRAGPQGAVVAIDPSTGRIVALVGGDHVKPGGFDRATDGRRQPGSAFKPFVYLEALRTHRYTPVTRLDDSPEVDGDWKPQNSHPDEFAGSVSMREALSRSLNLPAVKLVRKVSPEKVVELAGRLGIESRLDPVPALALGASSVTPLEMASAYSVIAAGGVRHRPWVVKRVTGPDGAELPLMGRVPKRVLAPEEAYLMTSMLESVVRDGTGRKARALKRPVAGKTGTSNNQRDAWFVGFSADLSVSVWVGFDVPRTIGRKEYGGRAALPIWIDFMEEVHRGKPAAEFERPEGIVTATVDPETGLLAYEGMEGGVEEVFIDGTVPEEVTLPPELISLDGFMLEQAAGNYDAGVEPGESVDAGSL